MLNQGALALMVSIGHRTGLFDTLTELPPADAKTISDHAGLEERYVREWLAAVVAGGILNHTANSGHYHLSAAHAAMCQGPATNSRLPQPAQMPSNLAYHLLP